MEVGSLVRREYKQLLHHRVMDVHAVGAQIGFGLVPEIVVVHVAQGTIECVPVEVLPRLSSALLETHHSRHLIASLRRRAPSWAVASNHGMSHTIICRVWYASKLRQ